jgi:hypothetical protein
VSDSIYRDLLVKMVKMVLLGHWDLLVPLAYLEKREPKVHQDHHQFCHLVAMVLMVKR